MRLALSPGSWGIVELSSLEALSPRSWLWRPSDVSSSLNGFEVEVQPHEVWAGYGRWLSDTPVGCAGPWYLPLDVAALQCFVLRCCVSFNHLFFGYPPILHVLSYKRSSPCQYPCMKSTCMCCCTTTPITCGISFAKSVGMTAIGSQMAARLFVDILNSLLPSGLPHC